MEKVGKMLPIHYVEDVYQKYILDLQDPRVNEYPLMDNPIPTTILIGIYIFIVTQGPKWMKNREAYSLKHFMIFYNFCIACLSVYLVYLFVVSAWLNPKYNFHCNMMDYSDDWRAQMYVKAVWLFFFSKLIEFIDTIIFVLRKKNNQISFLHVYHHASMPFLWWFGTKLTPGGESYWTCSINSLVHSVMYTYYLLAAFGPQMQKYLWWKKYMTKMQLIQFVLNVGHHLYVYLNGCPFQRFWHIAVISYCVIMIILFSNFYFHAYLKNRNAKKNLANGDSKSATNGVHNHSYNTRSHSHQNGYNKSGKTD